MYNTFHGNCFYCRTILTPSFYMDVTLRSLPYGLTVNSTLPSYSRKVSLLITLLLKGPR